MRMWAERDDAEGRSSKHQSGVVAGLTCVIVFTFLFLYIVASAICSLVA